MRVEKLDALRRDLEAIAARTGCELLDVNFGGGVLRVVLDREGGVTLRDCESVSREFSALLDVEDFGTRRYTLEVSSPGLDRPLYALRDYDRFAGSLAKITWRSEGGKRTDLLRLRGVAGGDGEPTIVVSGPESPEESEIPFGLIDAARLEPEF